MPTDSELVTSVKEWLARGHPSRTDVSLISRMIELLYEDAAGAEPWMRFLETLGEILSARAVSLTLRAPTLSESGLIYTFGGNPVAADQYVQHYFALDPFVNLPADEVTTLHRFLPREQCESTEIFREFLQPMDLVYIMGVDMHYTAVYDARLRISRGRRLGEYSQRELSFIRLLVPHLKQAVRLSTRLNMADSARDLYARAMDQLTLATIVLDEQGAMIHSNALAQGLLAAGDGLALREGSVALWHRDDNTRLHSLIAQAIAARHDGEPGVVHAMRVRRPSGKPDLGVIIRPLPFNRWLEKRSLHSSVALFIHSEPVGGHPSPGLIKDLFGLTPAEAALAQRLSRGLALKDAARDLRISPHTARAHLRSIFTKTGVTRQAELIRLLLRSVAVLDQENA